MRARTVPPSRSGVIALIAVSFAFACQDADPPAAPSSQVAPVSSSGPSVTSVAPNSSPPAVTLNITVNGSGFAQGSVVRLERAGVPASGITTNSTTYINPKKLVANITIAAAADTGKYDVGVTLTDGRKGVGVELFTVAYVLDELGIFGGTWSRAHAINDLGEVVGESCLANCLSTAFYWTEAGGMVDLATMPGYTRSAAYAITSAGAVFGRVTCRATDPGCGGVKTERLVRWDRSGGSWTISAVDGCSVVMPAGDQSGKFLINNNNQCVKNQGGTLLVQTISGGAVTSQETLPSVFPGGFNLGNAISDASLVAGQGSATGIFRVPVVWYRDATGSWTFLRLSFPGTDNVGTATDVGDPDASGRVRVSGFTYSSGRNSEHHAVRWTLEPDGSGGWRVASLEQLPVTTGGQSVGSFAFAVNVHGAAVGISSGYQSGGTPGLWPVTGGLHKLPASAGGGGGDGKAVDINRDGWIIGSVYDQANKCDRAAIWRLK